MKKSTTLNFPFCFLLLVLLMGCSKSGTLPLVQRAVTPVENPTSQTTPTPTYIYPPTLTPVPTLSSENQEKVVELLASSACVLPCYLGITPGITTILDAQTTLENLGASLLGVQAQDSPAARIVTYALRFGSLAAEPNVEINYPILSHSIILVSSNGFVQVMEIIVGTPLNSSQESFEVFRNYWSRYSARNIFSEFGAPDSLYTDKTPADPRMLGRTLVFIYGDLGIKASLYGNKEENNLCPEKKAEFLAFSYVLFDPSDPFTAYLERALLTDVLDRFEVAYGISEAQFYQKVVNEEAYCLNPDAID